MKTLLGLATGILTAIDGLWILVAVWLVIWRVKFKVLESATCLDGTRGHVLVLRRGAFRCRHDALRGLLRGWGGGSGGVEEEWTGQDLARSRLHALVGFPLGGLLPCRSRAARPSCGLTEAGA